MLSMSLPGVSSGPRCPVTGPCRIANLLTSLSPPIRRLHRTGIRQPPFTTRSCITGAASSSTTPGGAPITAPARNSRITTAAATSLSPATAVTAASTCRDSPRPGSTPTPPGTPRSWCTKLCTVETTRAEACPRPGCLTMLMSSHACCCSRVPQNSRTYFIRDSSYISNDKQERPQRKSTNLVGHFLFLTTNREAQKSTTIGSTLHMANYFVAPSVHGGNFKFRVE